MLANFQSLYFSLFKALKKERYKIDKTHTEQRYRDDKENKRGLEKRKERKGVLLILTKDLGKEPYLQDLMKE